MERQHINCHLLVVGALSPYVLNLVREVGGDSLIFPDFTMAEISFFMNLIYSGQYVHYLLISHFCIISPNRSIFMSECAVTRVSSLIQLLRPEHVKIQVLGHEGCSDVQIMSRLRAPGKVTNVSK